MNKAMGHDDELNMHAESRHLDSRMTWKDATWMAWDLETTGKDPRVDRPIQYGCAIQHERGGKIECQEAWIQPNTRIGTADFLKLTPEDLEAIRVAPDFSEHHPYIIGAFEHHPVLIGWNCGNKFDVNGRGFDAPMFAGECVRTGNRVPKGRVIDAMMIACQVITNRPKSWQLPDVAEHFGISFPSQAHRAGADSFVALSIMERLAPMLPDDLHALHGLVDNWMDYSWWLRETEHGIELNCGKNRGMLLEDVAKQPDNYGRRGGYLRWALGLPDLPDFVRTEFRNALK